MVARHFKPLALLAMGALAGAALSVGSVFAGSGGGYDLTWHSYDGGGVTVSTGGSYALGATVGQPDTAVSSGGTYTLRGGFWQAFDETKGVYLPALSR
jgi:hypothetical protein